MCCYACGTAKEHFAMHLISTYSTMLVKTKKINISILIVKGGAWAPSAPPLAAPLITVLSHAQIWYALNTHQETQTLQVSVKQKAKMAYREK